MIVNIDTLVIETTRRCWLRCEHCLRGEPEDKNIPKEHIENFLKAMKLGTIHSVVFTGGEPLMNVSAIRDFVEIVKKYNITIGSFYIATSCPPGFVFDDLKILIELYSMCEEKQYCCIDISNDQFHDLPDTRALEILEFVKITNLKLQQHDKYEGYEKAEYKTIIAAGRALDYVSVPFSHDTRNRLDLCIESSVEKLNLPGGEISFDKLSISQGDLYINCDGNLVVGCDWSYGEQETENVVLDVITTEFSFNDIGLKFDKLIKERKENGYQ